MRKLTLAATAFAVVAALAGCGRHDETASTTASSTTTAPSPSSTTDQSSTTAQAPATPAPTSPSTSDQASTNVASSAPSGTAPAGSDTSSAAMGAAGDGQTVYTKTCSVCHAAGVAGAPKLGDKSDWGPRIAQGNDTLYKHAMEGFQGKKGQMPPKGGNTALADADVKAAVDYMVSQAK